MAEVRRRIAWTPFEESALTRGFAKYGALSNSWAHILADPSLGETLKARSNTDLKDKWRNMQRAAAQGGRSVPTTTALQPSAQPPKAQPPKRKHSALNQGKRSASEAAGAGAAASEGGRVKREQVGNAKVDSPANAVPAAVAAAAPAFIYVILKQPSFAVLESVKLGKRIDRIKLAAAKLTAPAAEVCCPAYATLEAAQATAQSALLTYLNGTFKEGLSATALEQSVEAAKTRVPTPRSLPRRSAHTAPKEAPVKASTSSSTGLDSGLVVSLGPAGGASYTYHFPKGVYCDGERRKWLGGTVTFSVAQVPLFTGA